MGETIVTIYVCSIDGGYDGHYPPAAAFSTEELALAYTKEHSAGEYDSWDIEELVVDEPEDGS